MKAKRGLVWLMILLGALGLTRIALAQVSANFDLSWRLLSGGGGVRSSTNYRIDDSLGQWVGQTSTSAGYKVESGFWHSATAEGACPNPLSGLTLYGPAGGYINTPYSFVGAVTPANATAPVTYEWSPAPVSGQGRQNATYRWNTVGRYTIRLTVRNCGGTFTDTHVINITTTGSTEGDSYEVDDACGEANLISADGAIQDHNFHVADDKDWVRFDATAGTEYRVEVQTPVGSRADVNLELYAACDLGPEAAFEETFTPGVRLDFTPAANGPIYLRLTNFIAHIAGAETSYRISVRQLQQAIGQKGAVILLAGRLKASDHLQANIHHVTNKAYHLFKEKGYSDDEIYYLALDPSLPGYDRLATTANLREAITTWAVDKVGPEQPLTLYLMDHGDFDQLFVDEVNRQHINPNDLDAWLNQLETAAPDVETTVIIEACNSGSFIEGDQSISKQKRLVISSTNARNVAFASAKGAQFSDHFLTSLSEGYGICASFRSAQDSVERLFRIQEPWIDVNGNRIPNEPADCAGANSKNPNLNQGPDDTWAPYIVEVVGPEKIVNQKGTISAQVRDNKAVARVWAVVYAPSYVSPTKGQELVPENAPSFDLEVRADEWYSTDYTHFDESGRYRIAIYAEDEDGLTTGPRILEVQNGEQIFLPIIMGR